MSSLQVDTAAGWSASAHRPDHDGLSEERVHQLHIESHMWPPNSPDINPVELRYFGFSSATNIPVPPTTIQDGG